MVAGAWGDGGVPLGRPESRSPSVFILNTREHEQNRADPSILGRPIRSDPNSPAMIRTARPLRSERRLMPGITFDPGQQPENSPSTARLINKATAGRS